ncbi:glycosyltransferase family 22 protein [Mycena floridula]|nr:glycosyltransferase family 22 protein [Mycena floridula]
MSFLLDGLILGCGWAHVLVAPYTKVEESFNLHAVHDVLMYGVHPSAVQHYDHFTFPGAVPRTFVGSVLLAAISTPIIQLANYLGYVSTKFDLQIIVRLVLASINAFGLCLLRRAVSRRFGRPTSFFFALLTISQFHVPFWMGRTLPNMFALFPVNLGMYLVLDRAPNSKRPSTKSVGTAISLLTFTAVVFRAEVLMLLAPLTFGYVLVTRYIGLYSVIKVGLISGLASIALSMAVDSYFWQKPFLWPEFQSIYFNVYQGKSSDWGVEPFHVYFTSHLPKLLLVALPLSAIGFLSDGRIRRLLIPCMAFVGFLSYLGHKEWRFIVYVVPLFNIAAARGALWMVSRRKGSLLGRILFMGLMGMISANFALTALLTMTSVSNYPGGEALAIFNQMYNQTSPPPHVHLCNLAAQSGASLFLQIHSPPYPSPSLLKTSFVEAAWIYNKTEMLTMQSLSDSKALTHLIIEIEPSAKVEARWRTTRSIEAFDRLEFDETALDDTNPAPFSDKLKTVVQIKKEDQLWILERRT